MLVENQYFLIEELEKQNYILVDMPKLPVPPAMQPLLNSIWKQFGYDRIECCEDPLAPPDIDVFLVAGQSNAKGRATDVVGGGPAIGDKPVLQVNSSIITKANDPIGTGVYQAQIGSAWPQFGISWQELSGHRVAFALSAISTTAQLPAAGTAYGVDNWSITGGLLASSKTILNDAMTALTDAGYNPIFKGVLWIQGETDAEVINLGTVTQAQYIASFQDTIASYRADYGEDMRFYIIRIGKRIGGSDVGFAQIREAQEIVANNDPHTKIIYYGTVDFIDRNLMNDTYHYKQAGYNEIGVLGAAAAYNW
jgi:hypothetical protein